MKSINFRGLSEVLNDKEMKCVVGGDNVRLYTCFCSNGIFYEIEACSLTCALDQIMEYCPDTGSGCFDS
jgi:natural product precursor